MSLSVSLYFHLPLCIIRSPILPNKLCCFDILYWFQPNTILAAITQHAQHHANHTQFGSFVLRHCTSELYVTTRVPESRQYTVLPTTATDNTDHRVPRLYWVESHDRWSNLYHVCSSRSSSTRFQYVLFVISWSSVYILVRFSFLYHNSCSNGSIFFSCNL